MALCDYEKTHRVQVPLARGNLIPEIASISEDLPALCDPVTQMTGRSMSAWTLFCLVRHWLIQ